MITHVEIKNFKSIKDGKASLPSFGAIVGENAAGKTNLIQAINFVKGLVTGKGSIPKETQLGIIPQELFNFNEAGTTLFISTTLKTSDDQNYILELEVRLQNGSVKTPTLHITHEKLKKLNGAGNYNLIYTRDEGKLLDRNNVTVPLAVDQDKLVMSIYSDPDVAIVKKIFTNVLIPDIETINSRESLVTGGSNDFGLAGTVVKLMHGDKDSYSKFITIIKKIMPAFSSVAEIPAPETATNPLEKEKSYMILLEEKDLAGKLSMQSVSSGDLRTLFLVATAISMSPNSTFLVEEIENGLHPKRVYDVIQHLQAIAIKNDVQILFTTHSPKVINSRPPQEILFVEKATQEGTKFTLLDESDQNSRIQRVLESGGKITDYLNNISH